MAWLLLPLLLSGLLTAADFKSLQDGSRTKNVESPANANDWQWEAAAGGSEGSSPLPRPKGQDPARKSAKGPPAPPTPSHPSALLEGETTSFPVEIRTKTASKASPKNTLPETKSKTGSQAPKLLPQGMTWPWLVDATSKTPQATVSTGASEPDFETTRPFSKRKERLSSLSKKVTPTLAFLDELVSTAPFHDLIDNVGFSTATQKHVSHSPRPDSKSKIKILLATATSGSTTTPQPLDEILSTPQTLEDDTDISTAIQKHHWGAGGPGLNPRAKPLLATATPELHTTQEWLDEMVSTDLAFSTVSPRQSLGVTTSRSSATSQGEAPLAKDTSLLIGKCLLAILLLALVAAIFIVCSGVLATMLWRQKRACRLGQANHTEMVCISSLLSAEKEQEEEEEERRRRRLSKVKRVQLLGDTASETEADNLTLNSFLPEH